MPRISRTVALSLATALLAGCAARPPANTVAVIVPPPMVIAAPMPRPPANAALAIVLPPQRPDGSFATPNVALSPAAQVWHLRAALNVAALACADGTLAAPYNRLLATHRGALAEAHRTLRAEHGQGDGFDSAMTRLYNYFALPPAQPGYCRTAAAVLADAASWPTGTFAARAPAALAAIDQPFAEFFRAYAAYRSDLARWQAGVAAPRFGYDVAVLLASENVTGGATEIATR